MRKKSRRLLALLLAVTTFITPDASSVSGVGGVLRFNGAISSAEEVASSASAATEGAIETATASNTETPEESKSLVVSGSSVGNLRIIFTTDVHGQIVNYDYQDGQFVDRGLNLEYSIIKDARTEAGDGNYLTFDVGDSIMDFTTDYIYNQDSTVVQPVFKALALVGYDAITMGNHDFDYGYDYLMGQLQSTGLTNLCVLSNVYSVNNFQPAIGSENRIIEKKIKNGLGQEITVKVGILAETTPNLSTRTEAFSDKVFTEDIIINAEKQVKSLKEQGADIIIALAHSGFGSETPEYKDANASYALTKVDGIDVILAGHEHGEYPLKSQDSKHYLLSGVDKSTDLINGKRIVMVKDSCRGVGIIDLHIDNKDNKVTLKDSDWEIRKPTYNTVPDAGITATFSEWNDEFRNICGTEIADIKDKKNWSSNLLAIENTDIMQVIHNTQMDYAKRYIKTQDTQYQALPIVSVARYKDYSEKPFSNIKGKVTAGDVQDITGYHKYIYIYKTTGAVLRELLEWTASAYQTPNTSNNTDWNNVIESEYLKGENTNMLISKGWENKYQKFFEASGVEYTVDISNEPRYNEIGTKINDTRRITSMTINGEEIPDSREILIVSEKFSASIQSDANAGITDNPILKTHDVLQDYVKSYLERRAYMGGLSFNINGDKTLKLPLNYNYMLITGEGADDEVFNNPDVKNQVASFDGNEYYSCVNSVTDYNVDNKAPSLYLSESEVDISNTAVQIYVNANDRNKISSLKFAKGVHEVGDSVWSTPAEKGGATDIVDFCFTADTNGIYSVYTADALGNAVVEKIPVTNINPAQLIKPVVNKVKNNMVKVKGTASAGLTVHVIIGKTEYTGTVEKDGTFAVKIPVQNAKTKIKVYVSNDNGNKSSTVTVAVKRVGPNCPKASKVKNNQSEVSGKINDEDVNIYAVIGDKVYVSEEEGSKYYEDCDGYNETLTIEKTEIKKTKKGKYTISIPVQNYNKKIKLYNVDTIGRVSHVRTKKVKHVTANRPLVYDSFAGEKKIYGFVKNGTGNKVFVVIDSETYKIKIKNENGYFEIPTCKLAADMNVTVYAREKLKGSMKKSVVK